MILKVAFETEQLSTESAAKAISRLDMLLSVMSSCISKRTESFQALQTFYMSIIKLGETRFFCALVLLFLDFLRQQIRTVCNYFETFNFEYCFY
jgi:hypothetical protein